MNIQGNNFKAKLEIGSLEIEKNDCFTTFLLAKKDREAIKNMSEKDIKLRVTKIAQEIVQ